MKEPPVSGMTLALLTAALSPDRIQPALGQPQRLQLWLLRACESWTGANKYGYLANAMSISSIKHNRIVN